MKRPINRLLIANRGEIARRIIRTAHEMGMGTVAIYADGDAHAPYVREADEALALGGTSSTETYLDAKKVLGAASRSGADAIHPGYGFLAENAGFAREVIDAGMIWVGPPPEAIAAMGDKLVAKRLAEEASVPTLPAVELKKGEDAEKVAQAIGFPLLVKASAGGGGKGMHIVDSAETLVEATDAARREAQAAFGDDTIFVERWIPRARHVEIQILGDTHGNLVHCFERECSIQRRHQKIIEEAPSPAVGPELRERLAEAALSIASAIGYASAGTVEFLLEEDEFWFLEVNTRLQVEHPVTEAICGLDLVRQQLLVAQGEPLDFAQSDLAIDGHAIEARLYAEDPENDFLPATGTVLTWAPPASPPARFDSGIESGSVVGIEFDPMLAKAIVHATTRREAALRLGRVLEATRVEGLTTNRDFLVQILRHPEFVAGQTTTDFIERINPPRSRIPSREELAMAAAMVAMASQCERRAAAPVLKAIPSGWRNSWMPPEELRFSYGDEVVTIHYRSQRDGTFWFEVDEIERRVRIRAQESHRIDLEIDGHRRTADVQRDGARWFVHSPQGDVELVELPRFPILERETTAGELVAPMPGKVLAVHVSVGDTVTAGQLLLVLEAMKMEHRITAPDDGIVKELRVREGDQVANGELLVALSTDEES